MSASAVSALLVVNVKSEEARQRTQDIAHALRAAGVRVLLFADDAHDVTGCPADCVIVEHPADLHDPLVRPDIAVVLGGDGTMLRAVEIARPFDLPVLGVNLGHVGFLAEAETEEIPTLVNAIAERAWTTEVRLALEAVHLRQGTVAGGTWALNEVSVEKASRARMIDVLVEVDGRPLSRWGCDGVVCATPTGSTAYAFSAGGPVIWPDVEAMLVVPLSAHALFARPLVVSPESVIALDVHGDATLWADGRRTLDLAEGDRLEIRAAHSPVRLARLHVAPFTDRLVAKFHLPVEGWRGRKSAE